MLLDILLRWIDDNGIRLHHGIAIAANSSMSVLSNKEMIAHPQTVASIPKAAILSVRSCALAKHIPWVPYGHGAVLALSTALYSEMLRGTRSRWHGYLQSLPPEIVPIARLWSLKDAFPSQDDAGIAFLWTYGTEIRRESQNDDGKLLTDDVKEYYASEAHPLLSSAGFKPSLFGFLHAYSLVCSRAFLVDAYHGLSMVPIADVFNHSYENHVQLATEYDVCPTCGSFSECLHDLEDGSTYLSAEAISVSPASNLEDTVDMVTVRPIPPGVEIFNTYGPTLSNAALVARYGFMLEGGENDTVTFGWSGSGLVIDGDRGDLLAAHRKVQEEIKVLAGNGTLVYVPERGEERSLDTSLCINSDGQISFELFTWAVAESLSALPSSEFDQRFDHARVGNLSSATLMALRTLLRFEVLRDREDSVGMTSTVEHSSDVLATYILANVADILCKLCRMRVDNMGVEEYRGTSPGVLGEILDNLPALQVKTRLAIQYLLGERAILEACSAAWQDVRDSVEDVQEHDVGEEEEADYDLGEM